MRIEFLKDRYDFELRRKEELTTALTLPVGVLSGLGGLMAAMARSFQHKTSWFSVPFGLTLVLDMAAFVTCLVYLARAYHQQDYVYLPLLEELQDWESDIIGLNGYDAGLDIAEEAFESHIGERIIEAADRNTSNNERRSGLLHRARVALFMALSFTAVAGIFYVVNQLVG